MSQDRSPRWIAAAVRIALSVLSVLTLTVVPALAQNGTISGTLTSSLGGGIANGSIQVYDAAGSYLTGAGTNASGFGSVSVAPGTYYIRSWNQSGFINKVWDGANGSTCMPCTVTTGTAVTVTAGSTSVVAFTLSPGARLGGTVTRTDTGAVAAGETIAIYSSTHQYIEQATTNSSGVFLTAPGFPAGAYYAWAFASSSGLINELFGGLTCLGCSVIDGTPIVVSDTTTKSGIDFALAPGGTIGGTLTNAQTTDKVISGQVQFYNSVGAYVTYSFSNSNGVFTSYSGLPPGTYYARTVSNRDGLLNQLYDNINCQNNCFALAGTPIEVTAVGARAVADFALQPGARISGTVTRAAGGAAVPNLSVSVYNSAGSFVASGTTNALGVYTTAALESGSYYVLAAGSSSANLIGQVYAQTGNQTCFSCSPLNLGSLVAAASPATTTGINFSLSSGTTLTGTVTSGGAPVSGVTVQALTATGASATSSVTNGAGVFALSGLPDGAYYVRTTFNSSGLINVIYDGGSGSTCLSCSVTTTGTLVSVAANASHTPVNLVMMPGRTIGGTVTDAGGSPLRSVNVSVYSSAGTFVGSSSSNTLGVWTTSGLPPGIYHARTSNSLGYVDQHYAGLVCPACSTTAGTPIDLTATTSATANFSMTEGARISGTITDSGSQPLSGAVVQIYTSAGTTVTSGTSVSNGAYVSFAGLPSGTYHARASLSGYVMQLYSAIQCTTAACTPISGTPIPLAVGTPKTGIDFAMAAGGRVTGRVSDNSSTATPPAGINAVTVSIYNATSGAFVASGATLASGNYSVAGLPSGSYVARTSNSAGFLNELYDDSTCATCSVTAGKAFAVVAGSTTTGIDFGLDRGGRIGGTVTAADGGAPLASVTISVYDGFNRLVTSGATNQNGVYLTGAVAPGTYFVRTSSNLGGYVNQLYDNIACARITCHAPVGTPVIVSGTATTSGIDFALTLGGTITGRVTDTATPTPAGLSPINVSIFDHNQLYVTETLTNAQGHFTVGGLAAGSYFARTFNTLGYANQLYPGINCTSCGNLGGTPIIVTAGATTSGITFALTPGGSITGTVMDAGNGNAPLGAINVEIFHPNGLRVQTVTSNASGVYTARGLSTGNYFVKTANTLGFVDKLHSDTPCLGCSAITGTPVAVTGGATTTGVDFSLTTGGQITGTVVERASSTPVDGVSVNIYTASGFFVTSAITNGSGIYRTSGIPDGAYYARTTNTRGLIDQLYNNRDCTNCNPTTGAAIAVATGAVTPGINFSLGSGGRVRGNVTTGGAPAPAVVVNFYNAGGALVTSAQTNAAGDYVTPGGLPSGTYYARTTNTGGLINAVYDNIVCASCSPVTGKPIAVVTSVETTGINFSLALGGRLAGTVTDAASTPAPISRAVVQVFSAGGTLMTTTTTGDSGRYLTNDGLAPGNYFVKVSAIGGLITALHKEQTAPPHQINCPSCSPLTGTGVAVTAGATTSGIDFALAAGGVITGTVVDASTGIGLTNVSVGIFDATNGLVSTATTDSAGGFTSGSGMPAGAYYARTHNTLGYVNQVYANGACIGFCPPASGTQISVTVGATTTGVDFQLSRGGRIVGTVIDAVSGQPISSASLKVYTADGRLVNAGMRTDNGGGFVTPEGLPAGTYFASAAAPLQGYLPQLFDGAVCISCDPTRGTPIVVSAGNSTTISPFHLRLGGSVSGRVTANDDSAGRGDVQVMLHNGQGSVVGSSRTNADGSYALNGIPAGNYLLRTVNLLGLVDEAFDDKPCAPCPITPATATAVTVTARVVTGGVNFGLDTGGLVTGIVTDSATGAPLANVTVSFYQAGVFKGRSQPTSDTGFYAISLPAGTYEVQADPVHGYGAGGGAVRMAAPTTITVTKGAETPSVSFPLAACTPPTVSPSVLPLMTAGQPYLQTLTASGGTGPYSFSVSSGALATGLTLNAATGVISGTPSVSGTANFSVAAADSLGCAGTADFTPFVCGISVGTSQASHTSAAATGAIAVAANSTDCAWLATSNVPWLTLTGAGATGSGSLDYAVAANETPSLRTGTITIAGSAVTVTQGGAVTAAPFGSFDTPNATGTISGSVAVTGWALDDLAVDRVEIWRDRVAGETTPVYAGAGPGNGKIFIANPLFISGARPDVAAAYAAYPFANRAGWGYLMLTQGLWNQGNGTYTLYAFAFDAEGKSTTLGSKTITVDNANATKPFGGIDVPSYGQTVSGGFWNFGWGLTPGTCTITNGSVQVGIDSHPLTPVDYGGARPDIADAFPGFTNGAAAGGAYYIDTTLLSDGPHQIGWYVVDNCDNADGVGSRFFTVANGTATDIVAAGGALEAGLEAPKEGQMAARGIARVLDQPVTVQTDGGDPVAATVHLDGLREVVIKQGGRIALHLPAAGGHYAAYQVANGAQVAVPLGSSFNSETGTFYWEPAAGYLGSYDLVFVAPDGAAIPVRVFVSSPDS